MNRVSQRVMKTWVGMGTRFLPFADAATPDLPLSRLLRLSLFQVSVGMALVLLVGTLNRVMIVELSVPASLVGIMISLPLIFAPFRALIGFRSDNHQSELGWRRVPFIFRGAMVQFGGLAIMPFALLVLSSQLAGEGHATLAPTWIGYLGAGVAFLLVGAGLHTTQTVGLALATDLSPAESRPKVVGLMYVMLLFGMIASALLFGAFLANFTPGRLVQVIQGSAVLTVILNGCALWKQEGRSKRSRLIQVHQSAPTFQETWARFIAGGHAMRRLAAVGLGTMAFSMEDVLLEPYGGQILGLTVGDTTKLTATLAIGGLLGFGLASRVLSRGADPFRMASYGALIGIPAFLAVILSAPLGTAALFGVGTLLIGFGAGLFAHGTLTATMNLAPPNQAGLALGAWGAVQASAAGTAIALGGICRDVIAGFAPNTVLGAAAGYDVVYGIEILLLLTTLVTMMPLIRRVGLVSEPHTATQSLTKHRPVGSALKRRTHIMPISRIFHDETVAMTAVEQLKQSGLAEHRISVFSKTTQGLSVENLTAAGVSAAQAETYAARVAAGETLVVADPLFGYGQSVTMILDSSGSSELVETHMAFEGTDADKATPLSSALNIPVLSNNPTPLSSWMGWRTLSQHQAPKATLLDKAAPLSAWLGLKTLSAEAAPFSKLIGQKLLWGKAAPLSEKVGWKVLWGMAAPLSTKIGMKTLCNDPAPLSNFLKLPILKK